MEAEGTPPPFEGIIEVVRGDMPEGRAEQLVAFWTGHGLLVETAARERLKDVVCVALDTEGEIAGVNSVYAEALEPVGGRTFWVYRNFVLPEAAAAKDAMVKAAFEALQAGFDPQSPGPIGICLLIADRAEMKRRPEAEWLDPRIIYAGYLVDGRQVRIGYFEGALIGLEVETPSA